MHGVCQACRREVSTRANGKREGMKRSVLGMLSVAAGVSIFSVQDVIVKGLSATFPVHEIVVLRSVVALPVLLVLTLQNDTSWVAPARLWLHAARGLSLFVAYFSYYLAMAAMPIADVVAICFAAPLIITALSGPVLGERVKPQSWAAIAIGFAAVLMIVRPNVATSDPAALLPVLSALAYGISAVLARRLGRVASGSAMALSATIIYIFAGGVAALVLAGTAPSARAHPSIRFLLGPWIWPSAGEIGLLTACGFIAALGFFLLSQGYRLAEASRAAAFEYVALPWGVLWGFLVFNTRPDFLTLAGAAVLIATGDLHASSRPVGRIIARH
jgi:S-adenosylmethionine uptake transporter